MKGFTTLRCVLAGISALLLGLCALVVAPGAHASGPDSTGDIEFARLGSISVTKLTQPDTPGSPGTGGVLPTPAGSDPIEDVEFTLDRINIDLTVPANWDQLATLTAAAAAANKDSGFTPRTETTDVAGQAVFNGLPVGVYLVTESNTSAAKVRGQPTTVSTHAAPWIVVIPTSIDNQWEYDIHAYPKNSVEDLSKTVNEGLATGFGSQLTWPISSTTGKLPTGSAYTGYRLVDELDPRLGFLSVSDARYNDVLLDPGDYTVTPSDAASPPPAVTVTFALTSAGLAKVNANSGKVLSFKLNTEVISAGSDGRIENEVKQYTRIDGKPEIETDSPDPPPFSNWGLLEIVKEDGSNSKALSGAEFQVFASLTDAQNRTNPISVESNGPPTTTFVTGDDGKTTTIIGLLVGQDATRDYWIVETKAPPGYVANLTPVQVTIEPGESKKLTRTIPNTKQNRPNLPVTGGAGTAAFSIVGLTLLGLAVLAATRRTRKSRE